MTVRISEASRMLGVHPQTLRRWDKEGKIIATKTGNQRRYTLDQIKLAMKDVDKEQLPKRTNVIYCRVSSSKQEGDLQRQIEFMSKLFPDYEVISDVASGINFNRHGLTKLLQRVCEGEIERIAVSYKDRLARIGFEIFEQICSLFECEIIIVNNIDTSPEKEIVEDLIAITTSFSARIHGLRKYSDKFTTNFNNELD